MYLRIICLTVLCLVIGSALGGFSSAEEKILERFHNDFFKHTKLSLNDIKHFVEKENPSFGERGEVHELTNIDYMCGAPVGKCVNDMFRDKQQSIGVDFLMRQCDNKTCGDSLGSILSCNDTCSSELLNQEQARDCSFHCGLSMPAPAGMQLDLMSFHDNIGRHDTVSFSKDDMDSGVGEGISNLDSPFSPKYFDRNISRFNITFRTPHVNLSYFTMTTANDEPGRDIYDWKLEALQDNEWVLVHIPNISDSTQLMPTDRHTETVKYPIKPLCYDVYDQQFGLGQCDHFINGANPLDCATKFCPTCDYPRHCDYTCSLKGPTTNWCRTFPDGYSVLRFTPLKLRDNGTCVGSDIDADVWWTNETTKSHAKCGLPWLATDDWYCFSNKRNTINCPNERYDCTWNSVNTELNFTTGLYTDTFPNTKCHQIEEADDSKHCIADVWRAYYEQFHAFYTCGIMWNCMRRDLSNYIDNCTANHVTYDMDGDKCDQGPLCKAINKTLSVMPEGNVSCDWEHARATGSAYPFWGEIQSECAAELCDVFGDPRAKPGYCDTDRPSMLTCCIDGVYLLNRTVNAARTYVTFPLLTCEQLEYVQAFEDSCRLVSGPIKYMAPECKAFGENYIWKDRTQSLDSCKASGDIWRDKFNATCNTTRICDLAGSAVLGACDRKPVGIQKCTSSRVLSATSNETYLLQNMTLDNNGYCRCISPSICGPGGYCSGELAPPDTPPPGPVDCSSPQAVTCLTAWQGCTDPAAPIPDIWGIRCVDYVDNTKCTVPWCKAALTPEPLMQLTDAPPTLAPPTISPRTATPTLSPEVPIPTSFAPAIPVVTPSPPSTLVPSPPTSLSPATHVPTASPVTATPGVPIPTSPPATHVPTASPVTATPGVPTSPPATHVPTASPVTATPGVPTSPPATHVPTASPVTVGPTPSPKMPTNAPIPAPAIPTVGPTPSPKMPTDEPATAAPMSTTSPTVPLPTTVSRAPLPPPSTPVPDTSGPQPATPTPSTLSPMQTTVPQTDSPLSSPVPNTNSPAGVISTPVPATDAPVTTPVPDTTSPATTPVPNTNSPARTPVPNTYSPVNTHIPETLTPVMPNTTAPVTTAPVMPTDAPARTSGNCTNESSSKEFCVQFTNCKWEGGTCSLAPKEEKEGMLRFLLFKTLTR